MSRTRFRKSHHDCSIHKCSGCSSGPCTCLFHRFLSSRTATSFVLGTLTFVAIILTFVEQGDAQQLLSAPLWQPDENDSWYEIYKKMEVQWEDDGAGETGLADPTEKQYIRRAEAKLLN